MGDRFITYDKCPNCQTELKIYYAPTCGIFSITCHNCKKKWQVNESGIIGKRKKMTKNEMKKESEKHSNKTEILKSLYGLSK